MQNLRELIMNSTLSLLNLFPGHIYSKDVNGLYLTGNPAYLKTLGFSSYTQLIGKNDHFVVGERFSDALMENDRFVIRKSAEIFIIEKGPTRKKQGGEYLSKKVPLYNDSRNLMGVFGYSLRVAKKHFKLGELIIENISNADENPLKNCKKLSLRQIECLHYLLRGMSYEQVGTMLDFHLVRLNPILKK